MATVFEVVTAHEDGAYAGQAAHAAFSLLDRLEQDLSRFRPNSDVARINALRAGHSTRVSPATMECLAIARHIFDLTEGAFDVSLGSGLERLELDTDALAVHAHADGVGLDLGGIGKGFAVDLMAELVEDWGLERSLVHGGRSSVAALEQPPAQEGWLLSLSAPRVGTPKPRIRVRQQALSASGVYERPHIVDPRCGLRVAEGAVWVILPRSAEPGRRAATVADALSTAFMLLPPDRIAEACRQNPGLEVYRLRGAAADGDPPLVHWVRPPRGGNDAGDDPTQAALASRAPGEPRRDVTDASPPGTRGERRRWRRRRS
jgi:thiamine biosynthesis lipoprotein